ncbi:hypothetical protein ACF0H5_001551 [Mactra antiquata]
MITFLTDYYNTSLSYSVCDVPQTNITLYSGDLNCTASSSSTQTVNSGSTSTPDTQVSTTSNYTTNSSESTSQGSTISSSSLGTSESTSQGSTISNSSTNTTESTSQGTTISNSSTNTSESTSQGSTVSSSSSTNSQQSTTQGPNQTCNSSATEMLNCQQVYGSTSASPKQIWEDICSQAECYLQCLSDAVGNCYTEDEFIGYNMTLQIILLRAVCSNIDLYFDGLTNCTLFNSACLQEKNIAGLTTELLAINATENGTAYKEVFCQLNTEQLSCLNVTAINDSDSDSCTSEMISFLTNFYNTSFSVSECDLPQNNSFSSLYSDDLNCTASYSSTQSTTNSGPTSTTYTQESTTSNYTTYTSASTSQENTISSSSIDTSQSTSQGNTISSSSIDTSQSTSQDNTISSSSTDSSESTSQDNTVSSSSMNTSESTSQGNTTLSSSTNSQQSMTQGPNQTCNSSAIDTEMLNCQQVYGSTSASPKQILEDICLQAECYLQCLSDAVGNCYTEDEFIGFNMTLQIILLRAVCSNIDLYFDGLTNCTLFNSACLQEKNITGLTTELLAINATENGTAYKEVFCQLNTEQLSCLNVTAINDSDSDSCTSEMISFLTNFYNTSFSYSECDLPQNNSFSSLYSHDLNCTASYSSTQSTTNSGPTSTTYTQESTTSNYTTYTSESTSQGNTISSSSIDTSQSTSQGNTISSSSIDTSQSTSQGNTISSSSTYITESTSQGSTVSSSSTDSSESTSQDNTVSSSSMNTSESTSQGNTTLSSSTNSQQSMTQGPNQECSLQKLILKVLNCETITGDQISYSFESALTSFCENVECHIKCYIEAIGDCYKDNQAFFFDPFVYKVIMRAYCNNVNDTINAYSNCIMNDTVTTCVQTFGTAVGNITAAAQTSNDYDTFAANYCSAVNVYRSCVSFTPWMYTGCTQAYAALMTNFHDVSTSYKKCVAQNHAYFNTYGNEVACGGCSTTPYYLLLVLALLSFFQLKY